MEFRAILVSRKIHVLTNHIQHQPLMVNWYTILSLYFNICWILHVLHYCSLYRNQRRGINVLNLLFYSGKFFLFLPTVRISSKWKSTFHYPTFRSYIRGTIGKSKTIIAPVFPQPFNVLHKIFFQCSQTSLGGVCNENKYTLDTNVTDFSYMWGPVESM